MSFLVLLKGGVRKWQTQGYESESSMFNGIPVPPNAVFSTHVAAVFTTREEAQRAIEATLDYDRAQSEAGAIGFDPIPGIEYVVVEVP